MCRKDARFWVLKGTHNEYPLQKKRCIRLKCAIIHGTFQKGTQSAYGYILSINSISNAQNIHVGSGKLPAVN